MEKKTPKTYNNRKGNVKMLQLVETNCLKNKKKM